MPKNKLADTVFGWIEWICTDLLPFTFVEKEMSRKYSNLDNISYKTLMKYMHKLTKHVEAEIKKTLPDKFALVMDGWTATNSSYFVAIFAAFPSKDVEIGYETVLLTFSPLLIERRSREEHQELIKYALDLYGKSAENAVAITADKCKLNQCIADHIDIPMVCCTSHRFILRDISS